MKKVLVLVSMSLGLGFGVGCGVDGETSLPEDSLAQVEQKVGESCNAHYMCVLGQKCNFTSWTCQSYAVFGPAANPCIDDVQCHYRYAANSYCYYSNPQGSYGECKTYP